ncbi:hypothetical protein SDJN02_02666 [Cucurbita argyrosperma subsp. argyrosperma]|nr:hypothetical protein SDJN02_02666 [Cucurbita argyrosperma subsp. argyrosperma]
MRLWLISSSQMLSLHSLFNQNHRPPLLATKKSSDALKTKKAHPLPFPASRRCIVCSKETDSQQFEVDPDKARQALQELDQQLQSFSKKRATPPKKKVVEGTKLPRDQMRGEMAELSESFLANSAVVLFIFSIFYNVLFYAVIKPSIDTPLPSSISSETQSTEPPVLQLLPPSSLFISPSLLT